MSTNAFDPDKDIGSLEGRVILITGGTSGLGSGSAQELARHRPRTIFITGRNESRGNEVIGTIRCTSPEVETIFMKCDTSSFASVRKAVEMVKSKTDRLDIVMLNAGVAACDPGISADGWEIQFATNYLGHALMIHLLMPVLQQTQQQGGEVRVVSITSKSYEQAGGEGIEFSTLRSSQATLGNYFIPGHKWARYGQSKVAQLLFAAELARRYQWITSVSIHPGSVRTQMVEDMSFITKLPILLGFGGEVVPIEQGHFVQTWAATCSRARIANGGYYEKVGELKEPATPQSRDEDLARRLWNWTQKQFV